jgi:transposase
MSPVASKDRRSWLDRSVALLGPDPVLSGRRSESSKRREPAVVVIGIDAHMRSHTAAVVDAGTGRKLAELTVSADEFGHAKLRAFAERFGHEREWAIEDCRNLSRRLERALLEAGERVIRVPPKLMAGQRKTERTFGKSDGIDALAVARAALREPDLPVARLDGPEREIALLVNYRASLVVERTRMQARVRWLLFDLDPALNPPGRSLDLLSTIDRLRRRLAKQPPGVLVRVIREQLARIRELTVQVNAVERELRPLVRRHAGALLALPGIGTINAARLIAEVADVRRFRTEAKLALYAGVAPLDASSGRQRRHRLNRSGNRQLNAALHMIALTQVRIHAPARDYVARRRAEGKSGKEAVRALKRHLIRTIYRLLKLCADREQIEVSSAPVAPCIT